MSRDNLTSGTSNELSQTQVNLVFFVEINFKSGPVNLWSGVGEFSWDSKTWLGAGQLLNITPAKETIGVTATGLTITLDGVDPTFIALALNEAKQNKSVRCYFGFLDSSGNIIINPYQFFSGLVNYIVVSEGEKVATISVTAENDLIKLQRPRIRRYTDADHQAEFPGDLGFQHIASLQEWNGFWGGGEPGADARNDDGAAGPGTVPDVVVPISPDDEWYGPNPSDDGQGDPFPGEDGTAHGGGDPIDEFGETTQ